ncbi:MAG TPA: efflux RND transporter periplasmic adaptor subunit [Nevskiaceae bacterium]|nr:efflux RND transporter periplasmic adaptor subunit [Nevskiaceae bacterium]
MMVKRMVIMLVVLAVILGGVWFMHGVSGKFVKKYIAAMNSQAQTVSATTASLSDWTDREQAVGSIVAVRGADLSLQVAGIVTRIHFKSGEDVKQGQALLALDDREDVARLAALKAAEQLAQTTYDRDRRQFAAQAISQQVVDNDRATLAQARANVTQQQAVVAHKHLVAPFSGRLGLRLVDLGQYLNAGTAVVTLQALSPIYVDFHVPQQALAKLRVGQPVTAANDTWPGREFAGKILAISPKLDTTTRNALVRARLENPGDRLLPGMYATVDVATGKPTPYLTLPQTAINYHPYGDTVFIVTEEKAARAASDPKPSKATGTADTQPSGPVLVVHQQFITVGATRGDQIQILKGVKAGDRVVTSGQMKLRNGSRVIINNTLQPLDAPHPTPQEG